MARGKEAGQWACLDLEPPSKGEDEGDVGTSPEQGILSEEMSGWLKLRWKSILVIGRRY